MRLSALAVAAVLTADPALAQDKAPDVPVSLEKIREALEQAPAPLLKGIDVSSPAPKRPDDPPMFRSSIFEHQRLETILQTMKFDSGPAVPGGLYAYEQQQNLFPTVTHPLAQPYAAFSQGELVQVSLTTLITRLLAGRIFSALTSAERARAEEAAREEVRRAVEEYWAAQGRPSPPQAVNQP